MSQPSAAPDAVRSRIASDMITRQPPPRERYDDVERHARRGERPNPKAQWDEVHGCWVEFDREDDRWELVGTDEPVEQADLKDPADS